MSPKVKNLNKLKSHAEIAAEWDRICEERSQLIDTGRDFSLTGVTVPCIKHFFKLCSPKNALDIGCGTGYLTNILAEHCDQITGIDFSPKSIEVARRLYAKSNMKFECVELQKFKSTCPIDICVANMVLMSEPDLVGFLDSVQRLLVNNGKFLLMVSHPCFWPRYWGYECESGFDYRKEITMEADFSISMSNLPGKITHIHRSLTDYFCALDAAGFDVEKVREPYPEGRAPQDYRFDQPRFLFVMRKKR